MSLFIGHTSNYGIFLTSLKQTAKGHILDYFDLKIYTAFSPVRCKELLKSIK